MTAAVVADLARLGYLREIDVAFSRFLERLEGSARPELALAAALVSRATSDGHSCLDLRTLARRAGNDLLEALDVPRTEEAERLASSWGTLPPAGEWRTRLLESVSVGRAGELRPLVIDDANRLYLWRLWEHEQRLVLAIRSRLERADAAVDERLLDDGLDRLFGPLDEASGEPDRQRVAARTSVLRPFSAISGGPGTGKTSTVVKVLCLLLEQCRDAAPRIALAAPTGKAAARLEESIAKELRALPVSESLRERVPRSASTIHRLLGARAHSASFRHSRKNPLPADVVIVDEASMVDLALMSRLVDALEDDAHMVLLGDRDQLASVEAGAVLGDICAGAGSTGSKASALADSIVLLKKSYRFRDDAGIGALSRAVRSGNGERALEIARFASHEDVSWVDLPPPDHLRGALESRIAERYGPCFETTDPEEVFRRFGNYRILCALREGPYGVANLNGIAETVLRDRGSIPQRTRWYSGMPVIVTQNDHRLKLYNGDVGIVLRDRADPHRLPAVFQDGDGSYRSFPAVRLPRCETVYGLTVHKSQGSEFDDVLLLLPDGLSPVLTRELIYTAVTRARRSVEIWGREDVFLKAVARRSERMSGLRDALWNLGGAGGRGGQP